MAAIAVVIPLLYLAIQISDNTRELKSQSHYNALMFVQRPVESLMQDEWIAEIIDTNYKTPSDLSTSARRRFDSHNLLAFNGWEFLHMGVQAGAVTPELWAGGDKYFRELIKRNLSLEVF